MAEFLVGALSGLLVVCVAACGRELPAPITETPKPSCHYDVSMPAGVERGQLEVRARCRGLPVDGFELSEPHAAQYASARTRSGAAVPGVRGRYASDEVSTTASIEYLLDLGRLAADHGHLDVALRSGRALLAPASTWLMRPRPAPSDVKVSVTVVPPPSGSFATGLTVAGAGYALGAHELYAASFGAFGTLERRRLVTDRGSVAPTEPPRGTLEVIAIDGAWRVPVDTLARWVGDSAAAVGAYYGGFPVASVAVFLVPVPGESRVVFGKLLPAGGHGIVVTVGSDTPVPALYDDWVLVHELFHLGFPSFDGEGRWLDEGLATYVEPIIRARHGTMTEDDVWRQFISAMPQGLDACREAGLEQAESFRAVYWGGAIASLFIDVEARKQSGGARGLEHALRAVVRAGGHARQVWSLSDVIDVMDHALGAPVTRRFADAHAPHGSPLDLESLFRDLGVSLDGDRVVYDADAPLAWVRAGIVGKRSSPPPSGAPPDKR